MHSLRKIAAALALLGFQKSINSFTLRVECLTKCLSLPYRKLNIYRESIRFLKFHKKGK